MTPGPILQDAIVIGGGPAGLALAAALTREGLGGTLIAPHTAQPFPATYGAWLDELPDWAQACAADVWTDVRVYTGPDPTPLHRPYALLDNARFMATLLERSGGFTWTQGTVTRAERTPGGWCVHTREGHTHHARFLVDAAGHAGSVTRPVRPGGAALQTAYGLTATFDRPPSAPGAMIWMDYRAPHGPDPTSTFLYAMHLGGNRYFVEETSLIARPAPTRAHLRARLHARLHAQRTPPRDVLHEEWVAFPMNTAAPDRSGPLPFGAAGALVHPISGFQVAHALQTAPLVARAAAAALSADRDPNAAAWAALWTPQRRAARDVHLLGVQALLNLPGDQLPPFFQAFFNLPPAAWRSFLAPDTPSGPLARTMLRLFAHLPARTRLPLVHAALNAPDVSRRALLAAMNPTQDSSHPGRPDAPHAERMPEHHRDDGHTNADGQLETSQTETITEGMQGATGNADANGLDPDADLAELAAELRENLRPLTDS